MAAEIKPYREELAERHAGRSLGGSTCAIHDVPRLAEMIVLGYWVSEKY